MSERRWRLLARGNEADSMQCRREELIAAAAAGTILTLVLGRLSSQKEDGTIT